MGRSRTIAAQLRALISSGRISPLSEDNVLTTSALVEFQTRGKEPFTDEALIEHIHRLDSVHFFQSIKQ
jgi:hypothetical protein